MNAPVTTKTFRSGNSVAIRLPKALGIPENVDMEIEKRGREYVFRELRDPDAEKAALRKLFDDLRAIGRPGEIQERDPFEFPDRPGL